MMPLWSLVAPVSRLATAVSMAPVSMPPRWARFTPSAACKCPHVSYCMALLLSSQDRLQAINWVCGM